MKTFAIVTFTFGISLLIAASFVSTSALTPNGQQVTQTSTPVSITPSASMQYPVITAANVNRLTPIASISAGKGRYDKDLQRPVWSPDGRSLAVIQGGDASNDYHPVGILLYSINTLNKPILTLEHPDAGFMAFSPNGKYLASLGVGDGVVRLWNVESGEQIYGLGEVYSVRQVYFSNDSNKLLVQTSDTGSMWDIAKHREILSWPNVCFPVFNFQATNMAVSDCEWSGSIDVWDTETGKKISTFRQNSLIMDMAFSPDGRILAAWDGDSKVQLWDPETGNLEATLKHLDYDSSTINKVAFSPDGSLIASWNNRANRIQIWSAGDGKHLFSLRDQSGSESPSGSSFGVRFDLRHTLIISSWADYDDTEDKNATRIWDAQTGQLLRRLPDEYSAVLSPDGTLLATDSYDGSVKIWAVQ